MEVDAPHLLMAETGDSAEQYGMDNITAHQLVCTQARIQQHQNDDTDGACAHRGKGDEGAEDQSRARAEGEAAAADGVCRMGCFVPGMGLQALFADQRDAGEQEHAGKNFVHQQVQSSMG